MKTTKGNDYLLSLLTERDVAHVLVLLLPVRAATLHNSLNMLLILLMKVCLETQPPYYQELRH